MAQTGRFEMELGPGGQGTILLNGQALPFVTKVEVQTEVAQPNVVKLELIGMDIVVKLAEAELDADSFVQLEEIVAIFNEQAAKAKMRVE